MNLLHKLWKGLKGVGKWAVKHPESITAGISVFDARRRNRKESHSTFERDYTLSNLNERIDQLQIALDDEISAVRADIHTVATDLQQAYTTQLEALSEQLADIRQAQNYQARALKRIAILYGCVLGALVVCTAILFIV